VCRGPAFASFLAGIQSEEEEERGGDEKIVAPSRRKRERERGEKPGWPLVVFRSFSLVGSHPIAEMRLISGINRGFSFNVFEAKHGQVRGEVGRRRGGGKHPRD
jgi:hypothetical protein